MTTAIQAHLAILLNLPHTTSDAASTEQLCW